MTGSDHFAADDWVDFVRNVAPAEQMRLMQHHLSDGCQSCTNTYADWQSVRNVAATDGSYDMPDASLRLARAVFSIQKAPSRVSRVVDAVKVLFDSQLLPAVAGVRSAGSRRGRKVLCHMGDFLVDVQIEPARDGRTIVIGQVVSSNDAVESVQGVPVVLLRDLSVIGKGITNGSGEFHMEFDGPSGNLSVALGLREEGTAVLLGSSSERHS
jgi:hypothetical protein